MPAEILYILLLGLAVSMDGFVAGMAYGLKSIQLPARSIAIIGIIAMLCTYVAILGAQSAGSLISTRLAVYLGSILLIIIGVTSMCHEYLTNNINIEHLPDKLTAQSLSPTAIKIILSIVAKPETADVDHSKSINPAEAVFLGLALGLDNMMAAFGAALMHPLPFYTPLAMGLIQIIVVTAGSYASCYLASSEIKNRFPYLPGVVLILLGLLRLN